MYVWKHTGVNEGAGGSSTEWGDAGEIKHSPTFCASDGVSHPTAATRSNKTSVVVTWLEKKRGEQKKRTRRFSRSNTQTELALVSLTHAAWLTRVTASACLRAGLTCATSAWRAAARGKKTLWHWSQEPRAALSKRRSLISKEVRLEKKTRLNEVGGRQRKCRFFHTLFPQAGNFFFFYVVQRFKRDKSISVISLFFFYQVTYFAKAERIIMSVAEEFQLGSSLSRNRKKQIQIQRFRNAIKQFLHIE